MLLWHHSCLKFNWSGYRVLVLVAGILGGQSTQWFQTHRQTEVSPVWVTHTGWDWSTFSLKERLRNVAGLAWNLMASGSNAGSGPQYQ